MNNNQLDYMTKGAHIMSGEFIRSELLLGYDNIEKLKQSKVAIFGIGGVGSYVTEILARSAVGSFVLVDDDVIVDSNINRQIIALNSTLGKSKVDVAKNRILDINKDAKVTTYRMFYTKNNIISDMLGDCDYIIDAIDTVSSKIELICESKENNRPIISCMGTGNKLNPLSLKIADIYETKMCPLCRVMRKELRSRGIKNLKVVYSEEPPIRPLDNEKAQNDTSLHKKRKTVGSVSFVPSVAGIIIGSKVVKDLLAE